jgi:hypothetical protein
MNPPLKHWPITEELRAWWRRWGLTIEDLDRPGHIPWWRRPSIEHLQETARRHTLVANYLSSHPDVAARYRPDQRGDVTCLDVLALAWQEEKAR